MNYLIERLLLSGTTLGMGATVLILCYRALIKLERILRDVVLILIGVLLTLAYIYILPQIWPELKELLAVLSPSHS